VITAMVGPRNTVSPTIRSLASDFGPQNLIGNPTAKRPSASHLKDAGTYITKLPKAEHTAAEWQEAMKALILVATHGGPTMFARIGIMRALNRHVERVFSRTSLQKKHRTS
jgi:hypothetical protein